MTKPTRSVYPAKDNEFRQRTGAEKNEKIARPDAAWEIAQNKWEDETRVLREQPQRDRGRYWVLADLS